ncbi:CRISPR-associated endonuclease Cas2 [Mesorhizobium sp. M0179]|uniref:CRISPR-associated endonuclease Cas2 n=1 Tax=Mesorhizobium sp. M0179 TaxID=2956905 RepID=UPI003334E22C
MKPYIVCYDLHKQGQNYTDLIAKLKGYGTHWHVQGSVWVIVTGQSAVQIRDNLKTVLDANDKLIVARLQGEQHG